MDGMLNSLDARVKSWIEAYRRREKASKRLAELVRDDPWTVAMEIKCLVLWQTNLWCGVFYNRYDFDIRHWLDRDPTDWSSLPRGRNLRERDEIVECALAYTFWECARRFTLYMERVAIELGLDRYLVNLAIYIGFMYLESHDKKPADWHDWHDFGSKLPSALKEELLIQQAGSVGAQVSLQRNKRLYTALNSLEGDPFDNLIRELPGAVLIAYGERTDEARHRRSFVTEVTRMLEELGEGSAAKPNKLMSLMSEVALDAPEDEWMAEIDCKETLDALKRAAKLSPQQEAV